MLKAIERLKGWSLYAAILFVVIPAMEAAVWTLVGGFSHGLLIATIALGLAAVITAVLAAHFETVTLKGLAVISVVCFALFLGYAELVRHAKELK